MNIVKLKEKTNRINFGESLDKQIGLAKGNISVIGSVSERMDGQEAPKNFDSIPDVWFHALSYELALMDGSLLEDFRLEYEKNWRAIFASVCLSEILCIKVETERLSFKGDNLTLQGIAKGFIPHGSYFGDQTSGMDGFAWDSTVRYFTTTVEGHEINIALSSPSTIIVPAPDAFVNLRTHFPDQIPWLSDLEHSVVFSENSVPSMTESQAGDLAQFIHDYRHYLLQYVDESGANSVQRMLLNPLGKAPGAAGLLLRFEQDLVKTYNLSKLADGIFAISGFSCMSDIIASESFFLFDIHVYQLDSKTAAYSLSKDCIVVHSVEIDKRDYTIWAPIPVSKKGFEALKGADGWKIEYKHESTGAIIKELRLTLTLTKGNKKTVLSKIYATDKIHSEFDTREMCSAGIWPSRNYDGWSKYYLTTAYGNQNSILTFVPVLETDQYTTYPFEGHTTYIMHKFPQYLCAVGKNDIIIGYVPLLFDNVPWTKGGDALVASIDFGTSSTVIYIKGNPNKKITDERELCAGAIMSACPEGVEPMRGFLFPVWSLDVPFATKMRVSQKDDTNRLEALVSANILFPLLGASLDEFTNKRLSNNPELPHNIIEDDMKWGGSEKDKKLRSLYFQIIFQQLLLAARIRNSGGLELRISYPTALSAGRFGLFKGALNETKDKAIGNTLKEYTIKIDYMSEGQAAAQQIASNVSTRRCVVDIGGGTSDIFYYGRHKDSTTGREVYRAYDTSVRFAARDIIVRTMYYLLKYSKGTDMLSAIANANSGDFSNLDELKRNLPEFTEFQREFEDLLNQRSRTIAKRRGELYSASVEPLEGKGIGGVDKQEWRKFTSILTMCVAAVVHTAGMVARHSKDSGTRLELLFAGNGAKILDWIWLKKARFLNDFLTDVFLSAVSEDPGTPSCIAVNVGESNCEMKTEVAQGLIANALQFGADGQSENMDAIVLKMNGEDFRYKLKGGPKRARSTLPFVAEKFNNRLQIDRDGNLADMVYTEEIERFIKGFNRAVQKLNEKILRSGESGYQKLTLPQIAWDGINDSNDFIPVNMDDWRNARYSGVVRLTAEDTFIFNGIRNPDNVEEQSLFIIGVKALFGLLTKDFIEFISNSEYRTPPATIPYSREEDEEDDSDAFPGDDEDDEAPIINDDSDEEDIILNRPSRELVIDDEDDDE